MAKQTLPPSLSCFGGTPPYGPFNPFASDLLSSFQTPYHRPTACVVGSSLFAPFAGPSESRDVAFTFAERSESERIHVPRAVERAARAVETGTSGTRVHGQNWDAVEFRAGFHRWGSWISDE